LNLYALSEDALAKLTESADATMVDQWSKQAALAQRKRQEKLKAMDYFLLKEVPGISSSHCP